MTTAQVSANLHATGSIVLAKPAVPSAPLAQPLSTGRVATRKVPRSPDRQWLESSRAQQARPSGPLRGAPLRERRWGASSLASEPPWEPSRAES